MAQAVTVLGSWHGESVRVGDVIEAMEGLRRAERRTATRTSVLTLVIVAADADDRTRAEAALEGLGARHPVRTIMLVPFDLDGPARLCDSDVELVGSTVGGHDVWSERVVLKACGPITQHLDSLIEPLTLPDLPVAVWFVSDLPARTEPLLNTADALLVDSRRVGNVSAFPAIVELARLHPVVDLSWARLEPWRELLAGLFEGHHFRPFVRGVEHVTVAGKEGPRHLLAGWLASKLGLPRAAFHLEDAVHVRLGERLVHAMAAVEGGPSHKDVLPLPDVSLPWSLADALIHLDHDRTYLQALRGALSFAIPAPAAS
jgi:glucose-6-phosphate dehydrogenase assembly protein OpcA